MTKIKQVTNITNHLLSGRAITPIEALNLYGCFRLAAHIHVLRNEGMDIRTEMIQGTQNRYASYTLIT